MVNVDSQRLYAAETSVSHIGREKVFAGLKIFGLLAIFCLVGLCVRTGTNPMGFGDWDPYLLMARFPFEFTTTPYGYRIAVPYLASFLSQNLDMELETAFALLQIGMYSLVLTTWYLWATLGLKLSVPVSVMTCILFIFSYPGVYSLHAYVNVGFGEHLFVLLGCIAIYHSRFIFLTFVILISSFVKENPGLLLIPSFFVISLADEKIRLAIGKTAILFTIFLVSFLVLRSGYLFKSGGDFASYSSLFTWSHIKNCWNYNQGYLMVLSLAGTFGPTWLLALAGLFVAPRRLKLLVVLPVLAILQVAMSDIARMAGLGFPILLALSGVALDRIHKMFGIMLVIINGAFFLCLNYEAHSRPIELGLLGLTVLLLALARFDRFVRSPSS